MREIDCCWQFVKPIIQVITNNSRRVLINIHVHIVTTRLSLVYTRIEVVITYDIAHFNRRAFVGLNASFNSSQATDIVYIKVPNIHVHVTTMLICVYTRIKVVIANHIVYFTRWACMGPYVSSKSSQITAIVYIPDVIIHIDVVKSDYVIYLLVSHTTLWQYTTMKHISSHNQPFNDSLLRV